MPAARHHRRWRGSYAPLLLCRLRGIIVVGAGHMRHCSYAGCAASSSSSGRAGPNRRPAGSDCRAPHRAVPARIVARQGLIAGLLIGPCRPESSPGRVGPIARLLLAPLRGSHRRQAGPYCPAPPRPAARVASSPGWALLPGSSSPRCAGRSTVPGSCLIRPFVGGRKTSAPSRNAQRCRAAV